MTVIKNYKNKNKNEKRKRSGPKVPKSQRVDPAVKQLVAYAKMLHDPCNSELFAGIYGSDEGLVGRFKKDSGLTTLGSDTCGFCLWVPAYHNPGVNGGAGGGSGNIFIFRTLDSATKPTNTIAANGAFGSGGAGSVTTARTINDPANPFVVGAVARDARLISACMRVSYTGPMSSTSGQMCVIENLPLSDVLSNLPSVDALFEYSTKSQRFSVDTMEAVYRPSDAGIDRFRDESDVAVAVGATGAVSTIGADAVSFEPTCFGFAWRGTTAGQSQYVQLEFIKNVEWRPSVGQGMSVQTPVSVGGRGVARHTDAIALLDKAKPGWTSRAFSAVGSEIGTLAKAVYSGIAPVVRGAIKAKAGNLAAQRLLLLAA